MNKGFAVRLSAGAVRPLADWLQGLLGWSPGRGGRSGLLLQAASPAASAPAGAAGLPRIACSDHRTTAKAMTRRSTHDERHDHARYGAAILLA
jgi:hypothetical protein